MSNTQEIIQTLSECVHACEYCANACLEEDNVKEMADCIKADLDCGDICNLGMRFLSRNSINSDSVIGICIDLCHQCAEECEKHDHAHCLECARACRECEKRCRAYLN